jgi:hypothetical protein
MPLAGTALSDQLQKLQVTIDDLAKTVGLVTIADLHTWWQVIWNELPKNAAGTALDTAAYDVLPLETRAYFEGRIDLLRQAAERFHDGPLDATNIMYRTFAGNVWVGLLAVMVLSLTIALLVLISMRWRDATRSGPACTGVKAQSQAEKDRAHVGSKAQETSPTHPNQPATSATTSASQTQAAATLAGTAGTGDVERRGGVSAPLRIDPDVATITPCQEVLLSAWTPEGKPITQDLVWNDPPPSTGTIAKKQGTNEAIYRAPSAIAGPQSVRVTAKAGSNSSFATMSLEPPGGPDEVEVIVMVILMGALGGCLHWISSFVVFVGNRQLMRSWVLYYLLMPVEGSALAIIFYLLLRVGILSPSTSGTNQNVTAGLNIVAIYAFAGMAGIFSKQALQSLGDVFSTIFKRVEAKDAPKTAKAT